MNELADEIHECEDDTSINQPNDENPGSFFCIPTAPHSNDSWSIS